MEDVVLVFNINGSKLNGSAVLKFLDNPAIRYFRSPPLRCEDVFFGDGVCKTVIIKRAVQRKDGAGIFK